MNTGNGTKAIRQVTGRNLAHAARSASQRAVLAAELVEGAAVLTKPTVRQAVRLCKVCQPYVNAALQATPAERELVVSGLRKLMGPAAQAPISDSKLIELARSDANRLWRALERAEEETRGRDEVVSLF
jgi:hypothetical protein